MTCRRHKRAIALHAGGDLPARHARRLEAHLATCAPCRALLDDLHSHRTQAESLRATSLPDAMLNPVRRAVRSAVADERAPSTGIPWNAWPVRVGLGVAAVALLLAGLLAAPAPTEAPSSSLVATAPHENVVQDTPKVGEGTLDTAVLDAPTPRPEAPQTVIRLLTDDPDVVILLVCDNKMEGTPNGSTT